MSEQTNGQNGTPRLDRIEKTIEALLDSHLLLENSQKSPLRSQILLQDAQEQTKKMVVTLAESHQHTDVAIKSLAESTNAAMKVLVEAQQRMDDTLTALMGTVDAVIRHKQ